MLTAEKRKAMKAKKDKIPTKWQDLVGKLYLLKPIRTKGDYNRAVHIADMLAGRTDLNRDQADYFESLSTLIEAYENEHDNFDTEQEPLEVLKFLLDANGLSGSDLGRLLGYRELGSKILNGVRKLSKQHIKILAKHFSVEPGLFL
jgi:antitoxin component HigA of HigAB toxin-antitoxin module